MSILESHKSESEVIVITITRLLARQFRSLLKRCTPPGKSRGPAPPVYVEQQGASLVLFARAGEVCLRWQGVSPAPGKGSDLIPFSLLGDISGAAATPVNLLIESHDTAEASWEEDGHTRRIVYSRVPVEEMPEILEPPDELQPADGRLLSALHEAGRSVGDATRYRLDCIQLRGQRGKIISSDARSALLQDGFDFPFTQDLLIPPIPVFGSRELAQAEPVGIVCARPWLVVGIGPWTIYLRLQEGRYPDVEGVFPRRRGPTRFRLADGDASALLELSRSAGDEPITLHLDKKCCAFTLSASGSRIELPLPASEVAGPPVKFAVPRLSMERALTLGLQDFEISDAGKPMAARVNGLTFLSLTLPPAPPARQAPVGAANQPAASPPTPLPERKPEMNGRETNGRPEPTAAETPDPLVEAEELRVVLNDALNRMSRLIANLKSQRKQRKVLENAWSSLQQLNLGAPR